MMEPVHCIIQLVMTVVNMSVVSILLLAQQAYILEMNQITAQCIIGLMQETKSERSIGDRDGCIFG